MKKVVFIISSVFCFFIIFTVIILGNNKRIIIENSINDQIIKTNALTMMYETEVGSGEYQVSNENVWPGDEYIFNEILSKCENGSTLTWDDENKKVLMQANTSDKCYVYFDKYNFVTIKSVDATEITSDSITVSVNAIPGDGKIVSYHYSINDGEYISSNINSYTFENLNAETSYNISIYITDSNERKSSSYSKNFTTDSDLINFTITYKNGAIKTYYAKEGMTWEEWMDSDYNTDNFYTSEGGVCAGSLENGSLTASYTDFIEDGANYTASGVCAPNPPEVVDPGGGMVVV